MKYVDREGNTLDEESSQDRLLDWMYTNTLGRILLKPLVSKTFSNLAGHLLSTKLSSFFIKPFISSVGIDMSEYEKKHYRSYNDFFTRTIRPDMRPIEGDENTLISPSDGKVTVYPLDHDMLFSVKHTDYSLRSILRSAKLARRFAGGHAIVIRLTVDDYHRYCYCASGATSKNYHIQGVYHTVNPVANDYAPIYKENTREYSVIHTPNFGDVIQMEVGALMVGKITNHAERASVIRGQEKGYFEFGGSTIIVFVEKDAVTIRPDLIENTQNGCETKVHQGDALGVK